MNHEHELNLLLRFKYLQDFNITSADKLHTIRKYVDHSDYVESD